MPLAYKFKAMYSINLELPIGIFKFKTYINQRNYQIIMTKPETIAWSDFEKVEIRVGTIIHAEEFKEAKKPAYKISIDFGELGIRKTSAQITKRYVPQEIIGKQVVAVVNFPSKQIANFMSECLLLGAVDGEVVTLLSLDKPVTNGLRIA